jgi:uncharacterized protein (DUF1810 family)
MVASAVEATMAELDRFKQAQDARHAGYAAALAELRAGRKQSHWIWYVFPQLRGLGRSSMAVRYALADGDEAADYLRDPVLAQRLVAAASAVRDHVAPARGAGVPLDVVMGSDIDALKLVSSMTLFAQVAAQMIAGGDARGELADLRAHAIAILDAAAGQGYERCAHTERALAASGAPAR